MTNETTTGDSGVQYLAKGNPDMQPKTRNELMTTPSDDDFLLSLPKVTKLQMSKSTYIYFF